MYDSLLKDWHKETHINYSQVGSKKQEVLWMNFEPPAQLSIFGFMAQKANNIGKGTERNI